MTIVVSWWAIPRACRRFDQRLGKQRLRNLSTPIVLPSIQQTTADGRETAEIFELLAMKIRSGVNARHALEILASEDALPAVLANILKQQPALPLHHVLNTFQDSAHEAPDSLIAALLLQAYRHQSLDVSALDMAAQTIRDNNKRARRIATATAHSRLTLRILTVLPVVPLAAGVLLSSTVRQSLLHPSLFILLLIGGLLDVCGWVWMRNITGTVEKLAHPTELHQLLMSISISLASGDSLAIAFEQCAGINMLGYNISTALSNGSSLADALQSLDVGHGPLGQTTKRLLLDNQQSGTSLTDVVQRLHHDAEAESAHRVDMNLQQLSIKLALPTVFCVLPAFLLLALMPIAIASFGALPAPAMS